MKLTAMVFGAGILLAACEEPQPNDMPLAVQERPLEHAPLLPKGTIVQAGEDSGSVVYTYHDLRLEGVQGMRFCAIRNGVPDPPDALAHCPDTLYRDASLILLGRYRTLAYEGVYKRYTRNFHASAFPAYELYAGPLAKPDFTTDPNARYFKTRIREDCKEEGVNFGGHYTISEWGCGMACLMMALVDRVDGHVYFTDIPFDTLDGHHGLSFTPSSFLLEVNTEATDRVEGYSVVSWRKPATYLWNEKKKRFELLQTMH